MSSRCISRERAINEQSRRNPDNPHPSSMPSNSVQPYNQPTCRTRHFHPPKSSLRRILLLVILSCAPTQSLTLVSLDAKLRTEFIRIPALRSSAGSSTTTNRDAVGAHDTYIADGVDDVRICASLLILVVLTDVSVSAAGEITGRRGAFGARAAVHTWRTCELTVCQSTCCASLLILVILAYFGIGASRKVARRRGADRAGAAVETRRTWELALCQGIVLAGFGIGAPLETTERRGAYGTMTALASWRAAELTVDEFRRFASFAAA